MMSSRRLLAAGGLAVALAGVGAFALLGRGGGESPAAFASAPTGSYAVVARSYGDSDVITVVGAPPSEIAIEVATVPHLPGFGIRGAVSPNGRFLALIVPDGGTPSRPVAGLIMVDLVSGGETRLGEGVDLLQDPLWTPASDAIVVTRSESSSGKGSDVSIVRAALAGGEQEIERHENVLAVAPVGFDGSGALLTVVLDERGSTLTAAGNEQGNLSRHITRDWALSPDGAQLAFVEANLDQGLRYLPRVVAIGRGGVAAMAAAPLYDSGQALGIAWDPARLTARFGAEPGAGSGGVAAQGTASGFDVPLGYSGDGAFLAVRHWSGSGFDAPGRAQLEIVDDHGRQALPGFTRFFGWAAR